MKSENRPVLITRIAGQLDQQFGGLIDMSDWDGKPDDMRRACFYSRALAALCIESLGNTDAETAAQAVTDGYHDNGIDAIHYAQKSNTVLMVQSKWSAEATTPLDAKGSMALVQGVTDLLNLRFERFNAKVAAKESAIRAALYSNVRVLIVTAHTANQKTPTHVSRPVDDLVESLNDPVSIADSKHLDQAGVYGLLTAESTPQHIALQITLKDWGSIDKPFLSYYGRVHVNEIAEWWEKHGNSLFTHNLRLFYLNSEVNDALSKTLSDTPENFWYFNNGITVICDALSKSAVGSPGRQIGLFACEGASIVNGAQTVGTIGHVWKREGSAKEDASAWVQVRIISLADCPPDFSRRITRAANLQNAVGNREFAAMDPTQHRLATEFALDKRRYAYKQGEIDPSGDEGCTIVEATQALACETSIALTVLVKRNLGLLWADIGAPPYTDIFNEKTIAERVWQSVQIMRSVDQELQKLRSSSQAPRADLIGFHFNRVILHLVFQDPSLRHERSKLPNDECLVRARGATPKIFAEVADYVQKNHTDEYPAALSKNSKKCESMVHALRSTGEVGKTSSLF